MPEPLGMLLLSNCVISQSEVVHSPPRKRDKLRRGGAVTVRGRYSAYGDGGNWRY